MALWTCLSCRTAYAVGLPRCPHCLSTDYTEGSDVPKITTFAGVSHPEDHAPDDAPVLVAEAVAEPEPEPVPVAVPEPVEAIVEPPVAAPSF